jgi:hypothetical protein
MNDDCDTMTRDEARAVIDLDRELGEIAARIYDLKQAAYRLGLGQQTTQGIGGAAAELWMAQQRMRESRKEAKAILADPVTTASR